VCGEPGYDLVVERISGAEKLLAILCQTMKPGALVHGDLQAKNILVGPAGRWLAIDPLPAQGTQR
jgi:streptomycin 6-kinase